jgi:hypothetical protein
MIETAPKSVNRLTYDEAVLYCFMLEYNGKKGWRLPTEDEYDTGHYIFDDFRIWWETNYSRANLGKWYVIPVRDIKYEI